MMRTITTTMAILLYGHARQQKPLAVIRSSPAIVICSPRKGGLLFAIEPHEDDTISVKTNQLQRAGQIELIAPIYGRFRNDD